MISRKTGLLSSVGLLAAMLAAGPGVAQDRAPVMECAALAELSTDSFVVEAAEQVAAGPGPSADGNGQPLPEHCLLRAMLDPRAGADGTGYGIGIELRMPAAWNGRFAFQGGGGMDGILNPALGDIFGTLTPPALARGFAVVSTDGGHRSASMVEATFAVDQQARIDYAFNALDRATREGKAIVERYYGAPPDRSYLLGCSNGGRQGLLASQRYPHHFDGIVAGDPAFKLTEIAMDQAWNVQTVARISPKDESGRPILSRAFSDSDLRLVADAVTARCDDLDGLADGMINDWRACDFDPGELACAAEKTDACLSDGQVVALRDLHSGPRTSDGEPLYGAFPYDTGIAEPVWRGIKLGTSETGDWNAGDTVIGFSNMRHYALTPPDPSFDPLTFDFDSDVERTRQTWALGDADATYLETFVRRGKMIVYHGNSDQGMATGALTGWYDQVVADTGPTTRDAVRLFLVPGMTHCSGGRSTDQFDMLDAIVAWVEEGRAPDRIVATGSTFPGVSRPLCPHPQVARYEGGDPNDADSFACRE